MSLTGAKSVKFIGDSGSNSFADGDITYDGICEVCHTETTHFRNDGTGADQNHNTKNGLNCLDCHPHENGFKLTYPAHTWLLKNDISCESCHDRDGTADIVADIHKYRCRDCHSLPGFGLLAGTNGDTTLHGPVGVGNTSSCTVCHDPDVFPTAAFHHGDTVTPNAHADVGDCEYCHVDPRPSSPYWLGTPPRR